MLLLNTINTAEQETHSPTSKKETTATKHVISVNVGFSIAVFVTQGKVPVQKVWLLQGPMCLGWEIEPKFCVKFAA